MKTILTTLAVLLFALGAISQARAMTPDDMLETYIDSSPECPTGPGVFACYADLNRLSGDRLAALQPGTPPCGCLTEDKLREMAITAIGLRVAAEARGADEPTPPIPAAPIRDVDTAAVRRLIRNIGDLLDTLESMLPAE